MEEASGIMKLHTIYTITIEDYSIYEETGDLSYIVDGEFDSDKVDEQFSKELEEFNLKVTEYFSRSELNKMFTANIGILSKYNKITLLKAVKESLEIGGSEYTLSWFQQKFRRPYKVREDLKLLEREIEAEISRYSKLVDKKNKTEKNRDMSDIVVGCELVLSIAIDRNMKLYNLKRYIESANTKVQQMEEQLSKNGRHR
jgi:hypothetical protein